jgi:hypothetical protein
MKGLIMDKFTKITVGFVTQTFEKNDKGRFICTRQEFIAGDQCDYEDSRGNPIDPPDYEYQPYNMILTNEASGETMEVPMLNKIYEAIEKVLESLDVGGEQSRQFINEIKILRDVIGDPEPFKDTLDEIQRRGQIVHKLRRLAIEAEGLTAALPTLPVKNWLDGTIADATKDVYFEDYDLAKLLRFIADVGVSQGD